MLDGEQSTPDPRELAWAEATRTGDPLLFATGVLGFLLPGDPNPDSLHQLEGWQVTALKKYRKAWRNRFTERGRISIRSGHGVGKTCFVSIIILFTLLCGGPDTKVPVVANSENQLRDGLWPELSKWIGKLPSSLRAEVGWQKERVVMNCAPEECFAVARTATKHRPEALQGIHAKTVLAIFEEASGIPEETLEASAGALSTPGALAVAVGNPTRSTGFFHQTHTKLRHVWDTMSVSSESVPRARGHIQDIIDLYGKDSNKYRVRVLGEFPTQDDDTVIPLEWVIAARGREVAAMSFMPIWGVDVARFGDDRCAVAKRQANVLLEPVKWWQHTEIDVTAGRIKAEWDGTHVDMRPSDINIDVIGYGAGVFAILKNMGLPVRGVNVAEAPSIEALYHRLRDELWFKGREWFRARDCSIPNTQEIEVLVGELTSLTYDTTINGKTKVEAKTDAKKRGLRSPDLADAFLNTFATPPKLKPKPKPRTSPAQSAWAS